MPNEKYETPQDRYLQDNGFHLMVIYLEALILDERYTPSELREAIILAVVHYNNKTIRPKLFTAVDECSGVIGPPPNDKGKTITPRFIVVDESSGVESQCWEILEIRRVSYEYFRSYS